MFADPEDGVLGIGFGAGEAVDVGVEAWGANVFGKAVERVRHDGRKGRGETEDDDDDVSIFDVGGRLSVNW